MTHITCIRKGKSVGNLFPDKRKISLVLRDCAPHCTKDGCFCFIYFESFKAELWAYQVEAQDPCETHLFMVGSLLHMYNTFS